METVEFLRSGSDQTAGLCNSTEFQNLATIRRDYMNADYRVWCEGRPLLEGRPTHYRSKKPH